jgi:hypothetical protein
MRSVEHHLRQGERNRAQTKTIFLFNKIVINVTRWSSRDLLLSIELEGVRRYLQSRSDSTDLEERTNTAAQQ